MGFWVAGASTLRWILVFLDMARSRQNMIGIEIDKLTNSIENVATGEIFETEIRKIDASNGTLIKKRDWVFNWHQELSSERREIYSLTTLYNPKVVHGLISIEDGGDHIYMHLVESSKLNQGARKIYAGIPANLVAFSCKRSFELGYEGVLAFVAKTKLIDHYKKTLGARVFRGNRMVIESDQAMFLVHKYFKNFKI